MPRAEQLRTTYLAVVRLAALVLCGCASRSVQPEHLDATSFGTAHALIIGNTNYDNHAPLASAREDSAMLAQLFTERCDLRVQLLQDATEAQILAELERLEELVEDDFVLLYFSG